ncbi:TetR family transcriptional regulator [Thermosporothrix hazakensis]|jgi:AcrR family transcriptional regulator|uniref:TetR family transcriptional regulator n=1 Tax=Thermosporothrix hazakensis TaxID=644383 RepID=A0A326U9D9_THEHA|nr:TetR family transcriptional regulator [Thermosporothrix hazakensis]
MSDVANAAGLHRGLVYLRFPSKDELIDALIFRELMRYVEIWHACFEADPQSGTVAAIYRSTLAAIKQLPLAVPLHTRDEHMGNVFTQLTTVSVTQDSLQAMREVGAIRNDVSIDAMAVIMDKLSLSIIEALSSPHTASVQPEELVEKRLPGCLKPCLHPRAPILRPGKRCSMTGSVRDRHASPA